MPPRSSVFRACCSLVASARPGVVARQPLLAPSTFLQRPPQARHASILASLSDVPSAYNKRKKLGRGPASGKGKTSGRGHKGQKQHGKVPRGFNGGQTPDSVVNPERGRGKANNFAVDMSPLNLDRVQDWIDQGRLDPSKPITMKELHDSRCLHGVKDGVKLLARGADQIRTPIRIIVSRASAAAIEAVENVGGKVVTRYYSEACLRRVLKSQTDPIRSRLLVTPAFGHFPQANAKPYPYRLSEPTDRKDIEYYRDPAHRGYLSYKLRDGSGPSLFFKTPTQPKSKNKTTKTKEKTDNRIW
ncbi:mitochondrial 54S ribosomal protein uL15m [Phyllosticta citribraziliensis]|uniref:Ribosomal protein L18e/L15P n=1 Tax=Phyllosticta citribraziliensis TaxID=989973 RepID=A0ABR1L4V7_9PEZI